MRHLAFPKIPTVAAGAAVGGPWTATEKVHGAQLVLGYDGKALHVGKRRAWLADGEPFFGWQLLRPQFAQLADAALALGGTTVRVYGELYGGHYPHPSVPPTPGASPVQTGIWYSPDIRFAVFDVLVDDEVFLPYRNLADLAGIAGADVVPLLARGPLKDVERAPVRYASRVPAALGLPELPGNLAEGFVLRPDARLVAATRPLVKYKIKEFDEKRFGESEAWDPGRPLPLADLRRIAVGLVNPPRLASARSKVGTGDLADEGLADEVVLDVLVDLTEAFPFAMSTLEPADEAELQDLIRATARGRGSAAPAPGPGPARLPARGRNGPSAH